MDIMNELPDAVYDRMDDLLAFVSIYDDHHRTNAYLDLLERHHDDIRDAVCVEAGCGFGVLSEKLAQLGAKRVYAVEANQHLAAIARQRLASYPNVQVVEADIRHFRPEEPVDVLVHELFGQLLFDEDLYSLELLKFNPRLFLPDEAMLQVSLLNSFDYTDDVVTPQVLSETKGALISGLFDAENIIATCPVMRWSRDNFPRSCVIDVSQFKGDLLCFSLEIYHHDRLICRAGECDNWSLVWTPRAGNVFKLEFRPQTRGSAVHFSWLE
jgi:SAM-dependent methyltransferase